MSPCLGKALWFPARLPCLPGVDRGLFHGRRRLNELKVAAAHVWVTPERPVQSCPRPWGSVWASDPNRLLPLLSVRGEAAAIAPCRDGILKLAAHLQKRVGVSDPRGLPQFSGHRA